jgi:hypothetical protein
MMTHPATKTVFKVRGKVYDAVIHRGEQPEGEKFENYQASVRNPEGTEVKGLLKLTGTATLLAEQKAKEEGGTPEEWVARGCGRSLAAEVLIRKLKPDFSFVVDHRWI